MGLLCDILQHNVKRTNQRYNVTYPIERNGHQFLVVIVHLPWCPSHCRLAITTKVVLHDDVMKWKHFPRYWPFVRGIHRSPVNSPHKGQWRGALMFSLICVWINGWVNNREAGDLRRYRTHYDVIMMIFFIFAAVYQQWMGGLPVGRYVPNHQPMQWWSYCKYPGRRPGEYELNTLRPTQNGRRFADDMCKCIFINEKFCILIRISLSFVIKRAVWGRNIPPWALLQGMPRLTPVWGAVTHHWAWWQCWHHQMYFRATLLIMVIEIRVNFQIYVQCAISKITFNIRRNFE